MEATIINLLTNTALYSLVTLGMYLSFRVLDFPDLTVDGSFALGGCVYGACVTHGINPIVSTMVAIMFGVCAGAGTVTLHTKAKIDKIVSGLIVVIMLYSANLLIMGKSNIGLLNSPVLSDYINLAILSKYTPILTFGMILLVVVFVLSLFLLSEKGTILRAVGYNEQFGVALGANIHRIKIVGLAISNGLVAFAGGLFAQYQGFSDVNMGFGTITIGFASLVIGEALFRPYSVSKHTPAAIAGTTLYFLVITLALYLGLNPMLLKLVNGLLIVIVLVLSNHYKKLYS